MSRRREKMQQIPSFEMDIERLSHEGRGVGHHEGKIVFVEGALTGEKAQAKIYARHRRYDEARVEELKVASPDRVEPPCAHAAICGGCSLQHFDTGAQIRFKQGVLQEQLEHFGGAQPKEWLPPLTAATVGYRRKARLGVRYVIKKSALLIGFREKQSNFIADISTCAVLDERLGQKLPLLRELIESLAAREQIPQVEVAAGDDAVALVFRHLEPLSTEDINKLIGFCSTQGWHCYLQPAGPDSVHKVWPDDGDLRLSYRLPDFGLEMRFHPMDFTQVNAAINQRMIGLALELLDAQPGERILDLFCGLGNFTLPIATRAAHVVGVEGVETMVTRGYENARHNGLQNVEFHAQDLTKDFSSQPWASAGFDRILIDPPRSGALEVVQYLPRFGAKRVVYVSCNPATLARDAGELARLGYRLVKAGVMDMFPHTTHVESIAVFEKA